MKTTKLTKLHTLCLLLLTLPAMLVVTGCSGSSSAPTITFEAEYGNGPGGQGIGLYDLDYPTIIVANADLVCQTGYSAQGVTSGSNSQAVFTPPCNTIDLNVLRSTTANCPAWNTQNFDNYVGNLWQYTNGLSFNAGSAPYILPCASSTVNANLVPGTIKPESPPASMTMESSAGTFTSAYGMPSVIIYTDSGSVLGTVTASAVASDGSSITFSPSILSTYNSLGSVGMVAMNVNGDGSTSSSGAALLYIRNPPVITNPGCPISQNPAPEAATAKPTPEQAIHCTPTN